MISKPSPELLHAARPLKPPRMWFIECPACGFEPVDQISIHVMRCPKCHGFSWHRLKRPMSLMEALVVPRRSLEGHHLRAIAHSN
jgi:hypothetical protein